MAPEEALQRELKLMVSISLPFFPFHFLFLGDRVPFLAQPGFLYGAQGGLKLRAILLL